MPTKKYIPIITKTDFDGIADALRSDLRRKFDESKSDSEKPPAKASTMGAFDHAAVLDSKTVAKWSSIVKKYLGVDLNVALIRRGGYPSFDNFWAEMSARLRASCPDSIQVPVDDPRPSP